MKAPGESIEIIAYHGTEFPLEGDLKPSPRGTFGSGIYFADLDCAQIHGQSVYESLLSLTNALIVKADPEVGEEHDLDSPALPLLQSLFALDNAKEAAELYLDLTNDHHLGQEVEVAARKAGYDGLVLNYEEGVFEAVLFDSAGVKKLNLYSPPQQRPGMM